MTKIFVPQAIPEPAADLLRTLGEVTIFPHADRVISEPELLEAVRDKNILYAMGEIPYDSKIIDAAKDLKFISAMHSSAKFVDFAAAGDSQNPRQNHMTMYWKTLLSHGFSGNHRRKSFKSYSLIFDF